MWKCQSTFAGFNLKHLAHKSVDTFSIRPVVADENIV